MNALRCLLFFSVVVLSCKNSLAQVFSKPDPALADAVQKVINDIPNHLQSLVGELLQKDQQSSTYESKIKIPGSANTTITSYNSVKDKSKSIGAIMFETENFTEAKKKYNELINQLKATSTKLPGEAKSFKWRMAYDKPDESKNFSSTIFTTGAEAIPFKNVTIQVCLNAQITSYTLSLFIYEKKEDAEITGYGND